MRKILAIRPEPGLSATLQAGRALGLEMVGAALFDIRKVAWRCPDAADIDALLIGSANAILHGGDLLDQLRAKPVYAVGQATADAARGAGFAVAATGSGGLQNVIADIAPPKRLLRISGREHVPLEVPDGIEMETVIAYESVALPLDPDLIGGLGDDPVVLLHSAAAARHFNQECERLQVDKACIDLAVLGPRIASSAGHSWRAIHVSEQPNDRALLEMARQMCI